MNGGAIAGPAVGGVLLAAGLRAPFLAGASVYLILAVVLLRVSIASDKRACPPPLVIRSPWRDGKYLVFLAAMTGRSSADAEHMRSSASAFLQVRVV